MTALLVHWLNIAEFTVRRIRCNAEWKKMREFVCGGVGRRGILAGGDHSTRLMAGAIGPRGLGAGRDALFGPARRRRSRGYDVGLPVTSRFAFLSRTIFLTLAAGTSLEVEFSAAAIVAAIPTACPIMAPLVATLADPIAK